MLNARSIMSVLLLPIDDSEIQGTEFVVLPIRDNKTAFSRGAKISFAVHPCWQFDRAVIRDRLNQGINRAPCRFQIKIQGFQVGN